MPRVRAKPPTLSPSALLQLMWLASPALPVGGFSYSEGLEAAIDAGLVRDEAGVQTIFTFARTGPFDWRLVHIGLPPAATGPAAGATP